MSITRFTVTINCPKCNYTHFVSWAPFLIAGGETQRSHYCHVCNTSFEQRLSFSIQPMKHRDLESPMRVVIKPELLTAHRKAREERSVLRALDAACSFAHLLNTFAQKVKHEFPSTALQTKTVQAFVREMRKDVTVSLGDSDVNLKAGK